VLRWLRRDWQRGVYLGPWQLALFFVVFAGWQAIRGLSEGTFWGVVFGCLCAVAAAVWVGVTVRARRAQRGGAC
jgi:hypothetical protein